MGKKGMSKKKKRIVVLLAFAFVFFVGQPVEAAGKIRVGFFAFDGYHNMNEDGHRSGYGYEFIQKMLCYNNDTAVYIGYDKNWSQMQTMLENGEIDLLTSAQKTPEREEKFDFSEPIGTSAAILTIKAGEKKYIAGEYESYNGMRVGVIEGNSRNDSFKNFAKEKGFTYTLVYYDDMDLLTQDLQEGKKIDAIVTSNLRCVNNEWILDKFNPAPFYAMVKKGNKERLDQVNYAIEQMNSNSVGWQDELFDKYYGGDSGDSIALSSTERTYLKEMEEENKKIRVLVNPDRSPYSYIQKGKVGGIIPQIFEETARRLSLPYEYVLCHTRKEYQELVKSKDIDVVLDGRNDLSAAEDAGYKLTEPYMDLDYSVVERSEFSGEIKSVAALKLSDTSETNFAYFIGGKDVTYYDNMEECIQAVVNKKVDACYLYNYSGQKAAIENVNGVLQATTLPDLNDSLAFGVQADKDYRLLAILNKGARSVHANYVDTAIKNNTNFSVGNLNLFQLMRRNPVILISVMGLFALSVILFVYGYQKKRNEKTEREKNKELERFIGYVCKANTSVMEVNFTTGKAKEFLLREEHIEYRETDYDFGDPKRMQELIPKEDLQRIDAIVNLDNIGQIIDRGEDRYFEYRIKKGSKYHWYSITMAAIPRDMDHPNNMILFKRDINAMKKKEEETKQSLRDALDAANQASVSKGSFLSNMSHEIRTPLNAIIGYLSIAKDAGNHPEKIMHCIDNSAVASRHLLQIINDILDMSSIENGKLKIACEDFDLKKEITDVTTIFFQNAKAKGVGFETHIENLTEEWVVGDSLRLNQILMNLLSNAVKFTPEGGLVTLRIQQLSQTEKQVYLQFIVSDTGIGMSEEYMSRLFHPFEQENAMTAQKYGGSGLGLSITHNLISMMRGKVSVKSKQNQGTTFTVTMNFGKSSRQSVQKNNAIDYSHVRALIVDDQKDEGNYVKMILKRCGVKSDTVTSGNAALKRIRSRADGDYSYDLCILDWNMPEMDGVEVTTRIRKEFGERLPIIIATAYDVTELEEEAKRAGANKVVAKPLFQSTLFDLIVSTFGKYDPDVQREKKEKPMDLSGVHVLLAEDNAMNMDIAVTVLYKAGVTVDQAVNGQEAYQRFVSAPEHTYDLILMDVQMPILNGYEATRKIRESDHPEAKTIPIIAMTANAFAEDVTEALANGMNAHISKPINYDKLFDLLKKVSK